MQDEDSLYPFDFAVEGTPLSLQAESANKAAWIRKVAAVARAQRDDVQPMAFLDERPLAATIFYFPAAPMKGDIDNIVKPVLDALNAILYPDDGSIERVVVQRFDPGIVRVFESPTEHLAAVLDMVPPVLYVRIDDDLEWRTVK
ncbi:MAG: RusA family crossover junction endodeoxyribonuclease [Sphingomonas sp.]|nr:MAG: RusA family crossover junction endodeoxyribonuclease [Sphingomonas sp.]